MAIVPVQCWLRTFKIVGGGTAGTCFVISRHNRQWMVTAKHVVDDAVDAGATSFELIGGEGQTSASVQPIPVPLLESGPDIAVFSLAGVELVRDELTLVTSADGVVLSQEAFFLGYPLPWHLRLSGILPAVKRGTVSQRAIINGVIVWLIDGHLLPGFSGGPLVFNEGGGIGTIWHVLGVVSGYVTEEVAVEGAHEGATVPTNACLVVVYDIQHAIDAIDAFIAN